MRVSVLLLLLLIVAPLQSGRAAGSDAANAMAAAMEQMMEAMGMLGDDHDSSPLPAFPQGMPGMGAMGYSPWWPWAQMPWGQMPGYGAFADPIQAFGMPGLAEQMASQVPGQFSDQAGAQRWGMPAAPWGQGSTEPLDGIWEGRDGGLLIVRATRFRLQAAQGGYIEGLIRREGDQLAMYEPETGSVRVYELAIHHGRMVLRDSGGNTYLYRRLWLDERSDARGVPGVPMDGVDARHQAAKSPAPTQRTNAAKMRLS